MQQMSRGSHAMMVVMLLCTPGLVLAGQGDDLGDRMNQSSTPEDRVTTPATNSADPNDRSPEISQYMDQINKVREETKSRGSTAEDSESRGPMGEAAVGGAGPSGPSAAPPGGAPGYEGDRPKH